MKRLFTCWIFCLLASSLTYGQRVVIFEESFVYHTRRTTNQLRLTELLPRTIPGKQEVLRIEYSIPPQRLFDEDGKRYAVFEVLNPRDSVRISIKTSLLLRRYDWHTAQKQARFQKANDLDQYLKQSPNIQKNARRIRQAANSITGVSKEEIVRNVFHYVIEHLEYHHFFNGNRGARRALRQGKGDCTEYSELMIALCRAKGIPSRIVRGVVARTSDNPNHNWVEVYFKEQGWVPFDPTHGDGGITTFDKMENKYIYLSNDRFDDKLGYRYWDDWATQSSSVKAVYQYEAYDPFHEKFLNAARHYDNHHYDSALSILDTLTSAGDQSPKYYEFKGMILARQGRYDESLVEFQKGFHHVYFDRDKQNLYYAFANMFALKNEEELALSYLKAAFDEGFANFNHVENDEDLQLLAETPAFQKLVSTYRNKPLE